MSTKTYNYLLEPRDLIFMRDARPMEASDAGLGANWPRPDQLWNALINAFHRKWPTRQAWEGAAHTFRHKSQHADSKDKNANSSGRFGALKVIGPLPYNQTKQELFLPCPADWDMEVVKCVNSDLPQPLTHAFRARKLGKRDLPQWLSFQDYQRYLTGNDKSAPDQQELYSTERNIGIGIDSTTLTTQEGALYQAEYLRLLPDVGLAFVASCDIKPKGEGGTLVDVLAKFDEQELVIGGQQGVARLTPLESALKLPLAEITTPYLRWTLIAPALFNKGWLPDWIGAEGKVMLPKAVRTPGMSRAEWKALTPSAANFSATLIAVRIDKPVVFSGWDLQVNQPKPTQLAVPAGSSYVFDCHTTEEAQALAKALASDRPRSTMYGEKGFGYGICSSINL